jgi:basic membrane protein A and related proteins
MQRWPRFAIVALATGLLLAACSGTPATTGGPASAGAGSPAGPTEAGGPHLEKVAVAYDIAGRGDGGFDDLAYNGAKRAADELGAELTEVTAKPDDTDNDRAERLRLLAETGHNPIVAVGYSYAGPLTTVAAEYPDTWFGIVDDATVEAPNVVGITFKEEQGSFLVGVAAGLTSKTGKVGFVGALPIPLIQRFEAGFAAGAKAVNPDAEVATAYLSQPPDFSGFDDPAEAKEATLGMFDQGVDVVFAAAGSSGMGVIEAAHDRGLWAIGVDNDQYLTTEQGLRDAILTSMLKNADVGTYSFVRSVAEGTAEGGESVFDLASGGVGYATSGGFVDSIRDEIDAWADRIVAGEITVPSTP